MGRPTHAFPAVVCSFYSLSARAKAHIKEKSGVCSTGLFSKLEEVTNPNPIYV